MTEKCFVDTNILVYAHDRKSGNKQGIAGSLIKNLWDNKTGVVSIQVLCEFVSVIYSKYNLNHEQVEKELEPFLLGWPVVPNNVTLLQGALKLKKNHQLSLWDALIIQAATESDCTILYTEDMSHRQKIGPVTVVNPFM